MIDMVPKAIMLSLVQYALPSKGMRLSPDELILP